MSSGFGIGRQAAACLPVPRLCPGIAQRVAIEDRPHVLVGPRRKRVVGSNAGRKAHVRGSGMRFGGTVVVVLLAPCFAACGSSEGADTTATRTFANRIGPSIEQWRHSFTATMTLVLPGTTLGAVKGNGVVVAVGNGEAVLGSTPMDADAVLHVGSITKLFTAALILRLDQEGKLSLDDSIEKWFPSAPQADRVRVRMLVEHTSGLPDLDPTLVGALSTDEVILNALREGAREDPGSVFRYNNLGYLMLGVISERVGGSSWPDQLKAAFFDPLGLKKTYVFGHQQGPPAIAGYDLACAEGTANSCIGKSSTVLPVSDSPQWKGAWSAGGIASSARDITTWVRALVGGSVLDDARRTMMRTLTPQSSSYYVRAYEEAGETQFALGEGTGLQGYRVPGAGDCWGHAGSIPGSNGFTAFCPDLDLAITVLNNVNPAGDNPIAPGLLALAIPVDRALAAVQGSRPQRR